MPLDLFPYQLDAARWLTTRERAGLFDEMGIGKTAELIRAADLVQARRIIVVCPAMVRENWRSEFIKFGMYQRRIIKGQTVHDFVAWLRGRFDVLITSYEQMVKWAPKIELERAIIDLLIFDEAHYLKDSETNRVKALLFTTARETLIKWAVRAWWATGTPIPNDPIDIYTFLKFVRVMPLTLRNFSARYFLSEARMYSSKQTPFSGMIPELRQLIGNNSVRRTLDDVGIQLPPLFLTSVIVDGDTQAIRDLLLEHPSLDHAIQGALRGGGLSDLYGQADHIMTLRRLVGEAKALPYANQLFYELHNGLDRIVVFGISRKALTDVRDFLVSHGVKTYLINGDTPERARWQYIESFTSDPSVRVLLLQMKSGGTGINVVVANRCDVLENDWNPANIAQALKRLHRLGQTRPVHARFITLARSLDEPINKIVVDKTTAIASIEGTRMRSAPDENSAVAYW